MGVDPALLSQLVLCFFYGVWFLIFLWMTQTFSAQTVTSLCLCCRRSGGHRQAQEETIRERLLMPIIQHTDAGDSGGVVEVTTGAGTRSQSLLSSQPQPTPVPLYVTSPLIAAVVLTQNVAERHSM